MGRIEQTLLDERRGGSTPTDLRTFARNPTLPQEATDVSIYDTGPGLVAHRHISRFLENWAKLVMYRCTIGDVFARDSPKKAGARKPRPSWRQGPAGAEGGALTRLWTTESNTLAFKRC
jgi:hypothetical protein